MQDYSHLFLVNLGARCVSGSLSGKSGAKKRAALLYGFQPQHSINAPNATYLSTCSMLTLFTSLYTNAPDVTRANVQWTCSFYNRISSYKSARCTPTLTYSSVYISFHSRARHITHSRPRQPSINTRSDTESSPRLARHQVQSVRRHFDFSECRFFLNHVCAQSQCLPKYQRSHVFDALKIQKRKRRVEQSVNQWSKKYCQSHVFCCPRRVLNKSS